LIAFAARWTDVLTMRIAFDLDDTLIPGSIPFDVEPAPAGLLRRWFCREPLRLGTAVLFRALRQKGHQVWIYTTSFRTPLSTRLLFWGYRAPISGMINQDMHAKRMTALGEDYRTCVKYPPAFGIDVLVDDSEGVLMEDRRWNFQVIHVAPDDCEWTSKVLNGLRSIADC